MSLTEIDVAQRIRDGTIKSPLKFSNFWFVNLRITGTGLSYRTSVSEHVWRNPDIYLNDKFLSRCNGLPVIVNHPKDAVLNDDEFASRIVGCVMLPYIKGDEVWAICRVYSEEIVKEIQNEEASTSPSVVFTKSENISISPEGSEENVLIEGEPFLVDHIAIVTKESGSLGVWDKNGIPQGIDISNIGEQKMTKEELEAVLSPLVTGIGAINSRMDSLEAKADAAEAEAKAKADADAEKEAKAKADAAEAEEKAKADAAAEAETKAKADAEAEEKAKADAAKADAEAEEKAKADAEEDEKKADAQALADSAYSGFGKRARAPMQGESLLDYRKRMIKGLQIHSKTFKDVNIDAIADASLLDIAEKQIYADAAAFISSGAGVPEGVLQARVERDFAGHNVTKFVGDKNVAWAPFALPSSQVSFREAR